jgi:hypothetical protein
VTAAAWIATFPKLYILNIIRNPLDVIGTLPFDQYSKTTPGGGRPQAAAQLWGKRWSFWVDRIRETMRQTKSSCEVRFEDVCADPPGAARHIVDSLGLEGLEPANAKSLEVDTSKIGIYRSWIERGDLADSEIDILRPLATKYGFDV